MSAIEILPATPDDAEVIHQLVCDLCTYECYDPATTVKATPQSLRAQMQLDLPPFSCLLAKSQGHVAGFALYFFNYSTWRGRPGLYLEDLFVQPKFRQCGIGTRLLQALAKQAKAQDCARMEWSVLDWNTPAIDFYKTLGATMMEGWTTCRLDRPAIEALAARN